MLTEQSDLRSSVPITNNVLIATGLIDRVGEHLPCCDRAAVVTNDVVAPLYMDRVATSLRAAGVQPIPVIIPDGERHKTFDTLRMVYGALLSAKIERSTPLIGLGGGVTTDLAGFAAATLLRGLPYFAVPTSLLAMVDASVGGKTGVNHDAGKNLIGAFYQPRAVLIDPRVLATLPPAELRNGLAECIKHDVIRDADGFARLEREMPRLLAGDVDALTALVAHNVAIKAAVVAADPFEKGERAHLNFGHTFGHAIEKVTTYAVPHGEAVALGMCAAMRAAELLGMIDAESARRVVALIAAAGLPTRRAGLKADALIAAMGSDKKIERGRLRFVLTEAIGRVVVRDDVPERIVRDALAAVADG